MGISPHLKAGRRYSARQRHSHVVAVGMATVQDTRHPEVRVHKKASGTEGGRFMERKRRQWCRTGNDMPFFFERPKGEGVRVSAVPLFLDLRLAIKASHASAIIETCGCEENTTV